MRYAHLIGFTACKDFWIPDRFRFLAIHFNHIREHTSALIAGNAGRVLEVQYRINAGSQQDPLVAARQVAAPPESSKNRLPRVLALTPVKAVPHRLVGFHFHCPTHS